MPIQESRVQFVKGTPRLEYEKVPSIGFGRPLLEADVAGQDQAERFIGAHDVDGRRHLPVRSIDRDR